MNLNLLVFLSAGALFAAEPSTTSNPTGLPLREVILYTSGVGFFERRAEIEGPARSELRFSTKDINDLLKSLVVQDHSGAQVGVITYDSRDPLSKTLGSFAINLTQNPSLRDLLNQVRGARVRLLWPNESAGVVIGVERREMQGNDDKSPRHYEDFLNVFTGGTLKSIPLAQIKEIKLEDARLQAELEEALTVLAKGHDTNKKSVAVSFGDGGKRQVSVSYIAEAPVWKTSYRLVLPEDDAAGGFLQGWAIVENTGDEDWNDVQLSLVSGQPISFIMDLYQPLYATRPVVQPQSTLSVRPQVHSEPISQEAFKPYRTEFFAGRLTSGEGTLAVKDLTDAVVQSEALGEKKGTGSVAEGGVSGELFQYAIKTPVSIQRQKSALLPIVTERIEGSKLSLYNQRVQPKHPLNAFRLRNTTGLHLMRGPLTVFDGGNYAGDAQVEDLAPGQDRLISYALDLKTEVDPRGKSEPDTLVSVRVRQGTFFATKKTVEEKTYLIRNRDQKRKTVLIEHPVRADWALESPREATERARDVYRFKTEVDPGKVETLVVREARHLREEAHVTALRAESYAIYLQAGNVSNRVKDLLRKVVTFRDEIQQFAADRKLREDRLAEISQEQARIRENMTRLAQNSELYQRYVRKFDEQESEFEKLRQEASELKEREATRKREFDVFLSSIELD